MPARNLLQILPAFVLSLSFAVGPSVHAQTTTDTLQSALSPDSADLISAIASYPDAVRQSALRASQHPHVLTQLSRQQPGSQQAFERLIQRYGQKKQNWFYDLVRFPSALHALAQLPRRAKEEGRAITQTLPAESQKPAWKLFRHHHAELAKADSIDQRTESVFDSLVTPLARPTQRAFRQLLTEPDLLGLLSQQLRVTTQLGIAYRTDSAGTARQLSRLHDSILVQNQRELASYRLGLGEDPMARQELQLAGEAYAQVRGYPAGYSLNPADSAAFYAQNRYSFWFGYPAWYPSLGWSGTGYGYDPAGRLTVLSFPSPGFINWFFTRGGRSYPHLSERFRMYYDRTTSQHRYWTPRNSALLLATHQHFGSWSGEETGHSNWLTRPRYARAINITGSNGIIETSYPVRHYRSSHSYQAPSRRWSAGIHAHSSGTRHHSGSSHRGGYHGGSSHSRGPR